MTKHLASTNTKHETNDTDAHHIHAQLTMPSSSMTVESTSKQTASALAKLSMAPAMSVPWNDEARSPKWARISSPADTTEESVDVDE